MRTASRDPEALLPVSVVIPCLDRAQYLRPTIESVLAQDHPQVECIVVDGGSTDDTEAILRSYGDRVRWVSEPDRGHADAINKGWAMSSGEVLAWLNADDLWDVPHAASDAAGYLARNPDVDLVYGDCVRIDEVGRGIGLSYLHEWDLAYAVENCDHCIPQPTAFMRRSIVERVGWLDTNFYAKIDHDLWLRVASEGTIHRLHVVLARERACPGYVSDRGDITAADCVAVTRKFFSTQQVPPALIKRRHRAFSNSHAKGMSYCIIDGDHWLAAASHCARALFHDPANALAVYRRLRWSLDRKAPTHRLAAVASAALALPTAPRRLLRDAWREARRRRVAHLAGLDEAETAWLLSKIDGAHSVISTGSGTVALAPALAAADVQVTAVGNGPYPWREDFATLKYLGGSLATVALPAGSFELAALCFGSWPLAAETAWRNDAPTPARIEALLSEVRELVKAGATILLTLPVAARLEAGGTEWIWGKHELTMLLRGFQVLEACCWSRQEDGAWLPTDLPGVLEASDRQEGWRNLALACYALARDPCGTP